MRLLTLLFFSLLCTSVRAQIGLHPPSVDWKQIETDEGRIIFPEGYEDRAKRVATLIELLEAKHTRSIGEQHYPFDLILQTSNTTINGYVGLAPFRSEFFLTPPQQQNLLSTTDWVDLLTIHEYRHVQQNSNERRGITKLASYLFGQLGWAGFSQLSTPNWFSEGDAVVYETAMSSGGRGRTPAFSAELRSLIDNNIVYNYQQARNGSFKKIVPDHYRYGYAMLTYGREKYGNDMWKSVLHDGVKYKGIFYAFSRALKKKTGDGPKGFYNRTMADLKVAQDSARAARPPVVAGTDIGYNHKSPVNYSYLQLDDKGRLLALRTAFKYRPALVWVDQAGGKDVVLTNTGIQREPYVDVSGNLAVWMENRQDPRYTNLGYSDIVLYELNSGRKRKLTEKGKYFFPALSPDRKEVVVVEHDVLEGKPAIVVLDTQSGEVKEKYIRNANAVFQPRFSNDGKTIYFLDQTFGGISIEALDRGAGAKARNIRPRNTENIDMLSVAPNGTLIYSSGRDGVDNVYQLDPESGEVRQLTNEVVGALFPLISETDNLYYVSPTPEGRRLKKLALGQAKSADGLYSGLVAGMLPAGPSFFERPSAFAEEAKDLSSTVRAKEYEVTDVSDKLHGFKVHSWALAGTTVAPGVGLQGANALNTVQAQATVLYNTNENRLISSVGVSYGGWFPVITASATFSDRNFTQLFPGLDTLNRLTGVGRGIDQTNFNLRAAVPLRWVSGEFRTTVQPSLSVGYLSLGSTAEGTLPSGFVNGQAGLGVASFRRTALQQVMSTLGGSVSVFYDKGLGDDLGSRFLLRSAIQLPGVAPTHGIRLTFDYQSENSQNAWQYSDGFQYARGYDANFNDNVYRFGANYQLPIAYPEFGFWGIYYLKRLRLNAFFDHGSYNLAQLRDAQTTNSAGVQLLFDNVFFNTGEASFGIEWSYLLNNHAFGSEDKGDIRARFLAIGTF
jgi:hypothetical protein